MDETVESGWLKNFLSSLEGLSLKLQLRVQTEQVSVISFPFVGAFIEANRAVHLHRALEYFPSFWEGFH